jgi:hypothetical protein
MQKMNTQRCCMSLGNSSACGSYALGDCVDSATYKMQHATCVSRCSNVLTSSSNRVVTLATTTWTWTCPSTIKHWKPQLSCHFQNSHALRAHCSQSPALPPETSNSSSFGDHHQSPVVTNTTSKIITLKCLSMNMASSHRQLPKAAPADEASTSPFAFLDDPFHKPSSTFLFFSTIILASVLILGLMRHHYHRARTHFGPCPSCAQIRQLADLNPLSSAHKDGPNSSSSQCAWASGGTPFPDLQMADPAGVQEESESSRNLRVTASSTFYTPLSQNFRTAPSYNSDNAYCDENRVLISNSTTAYQHPEIEGVDLAKARREQSERSKQPSWPAALQKVVVGDVKDSLIAKRRRSTLKRRD